MIPTRIAVIGGFAAVALALAGCAAPASESSAELEGPVVWADYGGTTNSSFTSVFFDPFTEATGVAVESTIIAAGIQYAMFDGENGDYDAMMTGMAEVELYGDNLLTLPDDVPRNDLAPEFAQDKVFGSMFIGYAQGYLTETFPDGGPQTWADFWDTEKFPGMRAVPGVYFDFMLEAALIADGVAPEDLFPLDFDRAFAKLDELRPSMLFYTEYPQVQQLLASGSATIAFAPNGLYAGLANEGYEVTTSWDEAFVEANVFVTPVAAAHPDAVFALAKELADPEKQAAFSALTNYGPGNSAAFDFMTDEQIENLPNAPSHTTIIPADAQGRAAVYEEANNLYTDWLAEG